MTRPNCPVCEGWGFKPGVTPMQICDAPGEDGKPCTPRTEFRGRGK